LKVSASWTLLGNVVYAGCQLAQVIVLARFGPQTVGRFALGVALTAPVILAANLHLRSVQAADAGEKYDFSDYWGLRLLTTTIALLVIASIVFWTGYRAEIALTVAALGVAKAVESLSDLLYGLFQQRERLLLTARSNMIRGPMGMIALSAGVYFTGSVGWGAVALAATWAVVLVAHDVPSAASVLSGGISRILRPRWRARTLAGLAWLALPAGSAGAAVSLEMNVPRYFLEQYLGERELGIFAAIAYAVIAANVLITAVHQTAIPRLASYYAQGNVVAFRRLVMQLAGIGFLLGIAGVFVAACAGRPILAIAYGHDFAEHHHVFVLLMMVGAVRFVYAAVGTAVRSMHRFWWQLWVHGMGILLLIPASALLIPKFGLVGAAYAVLLTVVFDAALYALVALHMMKRMPLQSEQCHAGI